MFEPSSYRHRCYCEYSYELDILLSSTEMCKSRLFKHSVVDNKPTSRGGGRILIDEKVLVHLDETKHIGFAL